MQHAVAEGLELDGFLGGPAQLARPVDGGHAGERVEQRVNLALDVAVAVVVGGLPQGLLAAAVGDVVRDEGGDHLGVAHALGLLDGQLLHPVIAHEVEDADLERPGLPGALLVAALAGELEVVARPVAQALRWLGPKAVEAHAHCCLDGGGRFGVQRGHGGHAGMPSL